MDRDWLDNVFAKSNNDCPYTNNFYFDEHEKTNSILYHPPEPKQDVPYYKVINSLVINDVPQHGALAEYSDPDNPDCKVFPELDWRKSSNNKWIPPVSHSSSLTCHHNQLSLQFISNSYPTTSIQPINQQEIIETIHATNAPKSSAITIAKQSDSGANTSATNNLQLLRDVKYIKPVNIKSATKDATPMKMMAVVIIDLRTTTGDFISPTCFYSPHVDGTIILPDAIAKEFHTQF